MLRVNYIPTVQSAAVQGRRKQDVVPGLELVVLLALKLPISVVD